MKWRWKYAVNRALLEEVAQGERPAPWEASSRRARRWNFGISVSNRR